MKTFIKSLTKALAVVFIISFTILPFSGCSNKSANKTANNTTIENIADTDQNEETAENVSDEEKEETPEHESVELNGIYKLARPMTYKDTWYENEEEVIKFFETRDINGVYNFLRKLNFEENVNNVHKEINETPYEIMARFNKTIISKLLNKENTSTYVHTGENFVIDNKSLWVEVDEDGNTFLYSQFTYVNDSNQIVLTPLYVKYPMTKVAGSENIFTGYTYIYKAETAKIVIDGTNNISKDDATKLVSEMFDIDSEVENKTDAVVEILKDWKFMISTDLSKITILNSDGSFTYTNLENNAYTVNGITFELSHRVIDLETNTEKMVFVIEVDGDIIFTFSFVAL